MLPEERHNALAHVAAGVSKRRYGARSRGWSRRRGTAGHIEEAVIPVLHLVQHLLRLRQLLLRGLVHRVQQGDLLHEQVSFAL